MSIEVRNLKKVYGTQAAVNGISFSIKTGEIIGFLGPNGAGKSTTMKMITGLFSPTEGEILINGERFHPDRLDLKRDIGYLPENNPLYLDMYVKEYLLFAGSLNGINKKELDRAVESIIEKVGLSPERHKKIEQLSKGYRQRVGLAQALLHDPKILILDEPTTGLDPNQLVEIRGLIREVGKDKTILLSTHIMQEAEAVCDRVIIINKGEIVGRIDELKSGKDSLEKTFRALTQS
ncbi:ATP-binding cassette domain-containing protein [Leadbetterella byssophila]|uniref:Protein involved in gliding motility GldA n=1 Tax=Leadbetterella byssophila (strain DSM 17132 / JCM 16389 / KACC 11308 / NBRC 106382 / 4M15) TaxID=649349 RepID=E4RRX6_LEAB4|nr:ATP-binding cassette domain-containing protein [Leadbetterella byssophila]ADQ18508.1 protein involved in gliding motility GldA [Leadbetterella byssophila DSM 17132]